MLCNCKLDDTYTDGLKHKLNTQETLARLMKLRCHSQPRSSQLICLVPPNKYKHCRNYFYWSLDKFPSAYMHQTRNTQQWHTFEHDMWPMCWITCANKWLLLSLYVTKEKTDMSHDGHTTIEPFRKGCAITQTWSSVLELRLCAINPVVVTQHELPLDPAHLATGSPLQ